MRFFAVAWAIACLLFVSGCLTLVTWNNWQEKDVREISARLADLNPDHRVVEWQVGRTVGFGSKVSLRTLQSELSIPQDECDQDDEMTLWVASDEAGPDEQPAGYLSLRKLSLEGFTKVDQNYEYHVWREPVIRTISATPCSALTYVAIPIPNPAQSLVLKIVSPGGRVWARHDVPIGKRMPPYWVFPLLPFSLAADVALSPLEFAILWIYRNPSF